METAIITLTRGGVKLGTKLKNRLTQGDLYIPQKLGELGQPKDIKYFECPIRELVEKIFTQYKKLIFIMAAGIVVRSIAPFLGSKQTDPAVLVIDEKGRNVISLLSGHMGGANDFTLYIAKLLNANPVITTASDISGKMAVDTLAMELNCEIEDYGDATRITAHIVNGERIGLISNIPIDIPLPNHIIQTEYTAIGSGQYKGFIIITEDNSHRSLIGEKVILRPKTIVVGIGCKKGITKEHILKAINHTLEYMDISPRSIKHIATVDMKEKERGLIEAAQLLGVPLVIVGREDIAQVEHLFQGSAFVKKSIGVGAVCEPAALLTSNNGQVVIGKQKFGGVTIAVVREGER